MTIVRICRSMFAVAALIAVAVNAQTPCPPTPENYRDLAFSDARVAIEEDCRHIFTQDEQFFLAGIAHGLRTNCRLPQDRAGRALMDRFTKASALSLDLRKRQGPLRDRLPSHPDRASAFAAGSSMMDDIRCDGPEAALLARGIVIYLKRTSQSSRFVPGCLEVYGQRYAEGQCRCIADALRPVLPDVDQRFFDRDLVKESIHQSPRVAVTLMLSCGVHDY